MELSILGCYGNAVGQYRSTAFLINNAILLDAGTVTEVLTGKEVEKIRHVLVSHTHLDHIKGLFSLVDERVMMGMPGLEIISAPRILKIIAENLFNDLIWPDLTVIPSQKNAVVRLRPLAFGKMTDIGDISVMPVRMRHTVYTVGFVVKEGGKGFMYAADSVRSPAFWERARTEPGIRFIIADVSFPNRLSRLARASGHMTTSMLVKEIVKYGLGHIPFYVSHMKPIFLREILDEAASVKEAEIKALSQGQIIRI